jgi:pimeloyl-ACP methyl ester carboxylesterase
LFERQREVAADLLVPAWLSPEPRESLAHYAERLAASVRQVERGPVIVGGLSLGGMLAFEMSRHLDARAVVLMASCRSPAAVCGPLHLAERLGRVLPSMVVSWSLGLAPLVVGRGGGIRPGDRKLLGEMVSQVPVPLLRWGARAIMEWPGVERIEVPVHHIHGDHDWVIPLRCVKPTVVVPGGSHVLNLSHPREVNRLLREVVGG